MARINKQDQAILDRYKPTDPKLLKMHNDYEANKVIADRIIEAVDKAGGRVRIGVSASGLRFMAGDNIAKSVLMKSLYSNLLADAMAEQWL